MTPSAALWSDATMQACEPSTADTERGAKTRHLDFIDALRGYAVLGVIAVHVAPLVPALQYPLTKYAHDGAYGVQLFFVTSALTLCMSWQSRQDGAVPFYIRRFFRIAPSYWLVTIIYTTLIFGHWRDTWAPHGVELWQILMSVTFLNVWHPEALNAVVPGGWSVSLEMMFYACFPFLMCIIKNIRVSVFFTILSFLVANVVSLYSSQFFETLFSNSPTPLSWALSYLWFPNQFPVFLIGMTTFFALKDLQKPSVFRANVILIIGISIIVVLPLVPDSNKFLILNRHFINSIAFGFVAYAIANNAGKFFLFPYVRRLGVVSFSAYLWHFAVIEYFHAAGIDAPKMGDLAFPGVFAGVATISYFLSEITYRLIERPFIRIGGWLAARAGARNAKFSAV